MTYTGIPATDAEYDLAEGVLWDDRANRVRWVDLSVGRVVSGELLDGRFTDIAEVSLSQAASAVALTNDGGLLVAAERGLATIAPSGVVSLGPSLLGSPSGLSLNDATVDVFGALVVGTSSVAGDTGEDVLLRVLPNGRVEVLRDGVRLSNGIAFSPDNKTIYHVDTYAGTVSSHSYGGGKFDRTEPWVIVLSDLPHYPDGLTVDAAGALWVAQWGGANVRRHAPTGDLLGLVTVDAEQVSCAGFVGSSLNLLAITTAQQGLESFTDLSGAIFLADVDVPGLASHRWAGSTIHPYWLKTAEEMDKA